MRPGIRFAVWALVAAWAGWVVCSIVALGGAEERPQAGSSGAAIAVEVLVMAISGNTSIGWALAGTRIFGGAMLLLIVALLAWWWRNGRSAARMDAASEASAGAEP